MQEVFDANAKDTNLVTKLTFKIFDVIAEKGKVDSDGEFIKSCLELFMRCVFPEKKYVVEQLSLSVFTKFVANR